MKHETDMDQLLRQALSPEKEPDYWLNQRILRKAKETEEMSRKYNKRIPVTALAAVLVLSVGSATAVAAWKYLTPDKVAEVVEDQSLAAAFQSKDAIAINESQEYGDYKITLLGVVSGKNLSQYVSKDDAGNIRDDRTYVVTAIENADGTPRPATRDDDYGKDPFFVSPLIKGQDPSQFNIITMGGGYMEIVQDGIQYRIAESDNVEIFADQTLYLCVNSGTFYDRNAYQFDEKTGEITRNESYEGVNALFRLPLDESKADQEAAKAYIQELKEGLQEDQAESEKGQEKNAAEEADFISQAAEEIEEWKEADFEKNAVLLEELTQTLTPDADDCISYAYDIGENGQSYEATVSLKGMFEEDQVGMSKQRNIMGGSTQDEVYIETFTQNEDGTVTLKIFQYKK